MYLHMYVTYVSYISHLHIHTLMKLHMTHTHEHTGEAKLDAIWKEQDQLGVRNERGKKLRSSHNMTLTRREYTGERHSPQHT